MVTTYTSEPVRHLKKMTMDLISSANDIFVLYISETASLSRASAADNLSGCAWIAEGYLSARDSTVEKNLF